MILYAVDYYENVCGVILHWIYDIIFFSILFARNHGIFKHFEGHILVGNHFENISILKLARHREEVAVCSVTR